MFCTGRTAHRGSRGIYLLFYDHNTRRGWEVSVTPRPLFTPGKYPVPIVQKAGWDPGSVWTGAENFAPTGIRSPDRPALSRSLYRLRYPAHIFWIVLWNFTYEWKKKCLYVIHKDPNASKFMLIHYATEVLCVWERLTVCQRITNSRTRQTLAAPTIILTPEIK